MQIVYRGIEIMHKKYDKNTALHIIHTRKSVREFKQESIPNEHLEDMVRAGMAAPSANNHQPWEFIIVTDKYIKGFLAERLPYAKMLKDAAAGIVVCGKPGDAFNEPEGSLWVQDCSAATLNILLAAEALGYGAVWTAVYPASDRINTVKDILALPKGILPLSVIPVGIPIGNELPKDKYVKEKIHWDKW